MSTILKSLKKLEQERETARYAVQSAGYKGSGAFSVTKGPGRWSKRIWIRRSLVAILILGLGATTLYFYQLSKGRLPSPAEPMASSPSPPVNRFAGDNTKKPSQTITSRENTRQMARARENRPQSAHPPVRRPITESVSPPRPLKRQNAPALSTAKPPPIPNSGEPPKPAPTLQRRKAAESTQGVAPHRQTVPTAAVQPKDQTSTTGALTPNRSVPQKETQRTDAYPDVRPLTDGRLKVHAIVWSDNQEDRMAVINTHILHEGESVAGFTVVAIRSDDVVVRREGGGMWRIIFGRP